MPTDRRRPLWVAAAARGPYPSSPRRRSWALDVEGTVLRLPVPIDEVREELRILAEDRGLAMRFSPLLQKIAEAASQVGADFVAAAYALVERHELAAAARASLCPGARELLTLAAAREEPVLLVSNSAASALRLAFQVCGLEPGEHALVGRRVGLPPKPDPAPLLEALTALPPEAQPKLLVCVGDRVPDVMMARSAAPILAARGIQVHAVGVAAEAEARAKLHEAGADQVVTDLLALL